MGFLEEDTSAVCSIHHGVKNKIKDRIHETKVKIRSLVHCAIILRVFAQIMGREVGVQDQFSEASSGGNLCYMQ